MSKIRQQPQTESTKEVDATVAELKATIKQLEANIDQAKEQTLRSQADYQNLVRRNQEERTKMVKLATQELVEALLEPFDHLEMAAAQLQDKGLDMVVEQFNRVFHAYGVEEIEVANRPFDVQTMEVVETKNPESDIVTAVRRKGYRLHGAVIRHAKVVVGEADDLHS